MHCRNHRPALRRSLATAIGLACALAHASDARADGETSATFAWVRGRGAEQCADAATVRAAVEARVGRPVFRDDAPVSVEASVARTQGPDGAQWSAQVFVRARDGTLLGERALASDQAGCAPIVAAVALVVAVTLDADAALRSAAPPTAATPAAPSTAAAPPAPAPRRATRPRRAPVAAACPPAAPPPPRWEAAIGTHLAGALGVLPLPALGAGLSVELAPPLRWPRFVASAWFWPEVRQPVENSGGRVGVALAGAALDVCPLALARGPLLLTACGGAFVGELRVVGYDYDWTRAYARPYVALELGGRARVRLGPVFAEVRLEGAVPVIRDTYVVEGFGVAFTPPAVGLRGALGAGVEFR